MDFSGDMKADSHESDHFSNLLEITESNSKNVSFRKVNKANCDKLKMFYKENLTKNNNIDSAECFTEILNIIEKECNLKNSTPDKHDRP